MVFNRALVSFYNICIFIYIYFCLTEMGTILNKIFISNSDNENPHELDCSC